MQKSSCSALLRCRLDPTASISVTGLSPSVARLSSRFSYLRSVSLSTVLQPRRMPRHGRFGLLRVRSPLLAQSLLFSFPPGNEMFQFPGFASRYGVIPSLRTVGCPIRTSAPQWVFAPKRGFSQLVTSFFASKSPGILHVPFSPFLFSLPWPVRRYNAAPRSVLCEFTFFCCCSCLFLFPASSMSMSSFVSL